MRLILAPHIPPCWLLPTELLELSIRVLTPSPLLTLNAVLVRLQQKFEVVAVEMMDDDGHRLRTPSSSASYKWRFRCFQRPVWLGPTQRAVVADWRWFGEL